MLPKMWVDRQRAIIAERRYKAVLDAPFGRQAYGVYMKRHNTRPSLHQLKTMRRSVVKRDNDRRREKALSFGAMYGANQRQLQALLRSASGTAPIPFRYRTLDDTKTYWVSRTTGRVTAHPPVVGRMSSAESNLPRVRKFTDNDVYRHAPGFAAQSNAAVHVSDLADDAVWFREDVSADWDRLRRETFAKMGKRYYDFADVERKLYSRTVEDITHREDAAFMRPTSRYDSPSLPTAPDPTDSRLPVVVDKRILAKDAIAFQDIPDGAFVEHLESRNVGVKSNRGISWLVHHNATGGFTEASFFSVSRPVFRAVDVVVTINR